MPRRSKASPRALCRPQRRAPVAECPSSCARTARRPLTSHWRWVRASRTRRPAMWTRARAC
eukprot:2056349-Prymnesium_polylepis.1